MKEVKLLRRLLGCMESVHLGILTCCLSLPLFFAVREFPDAEEIYWALGVALPVVLINIACRHLEARWQQLAAGLLVLGLSLLICRTALLRVVFTICIGLQIFLCTALPRPDSRIVLTVPKLYHALAPLLLFAFSRIFLSAEMELAAVMIATLFCVNTLLYYHTKRLMLALCDRGAAAVSDRGILRLNRRLMVVLCVAGAALVIAVPLLMQRSAQTAPVEYELTPAETEQAQRTTEEETETTDWMIRPAGQELAYKPATTAAEVFFLLLGVAVAALVVLAIVLLLRSLRDDREQHSPPGESDVVVQALPRKQKRAVSAQPLQGSWAQKIRRLYQKLIRSRTPKKASLAALTPTELERAALLRGPDAERLHQLYELARYSEKTCEKSDYLAAKAAASQLKRGESGT